MTDNDRTIRELTELYLNEEAVREFDSIMSRHKRKRFLRNSLACAAGVLLIVSVTLLFRANSKSEAMPGITTTEILETISILCNIDSGNIDNITATPDGARVLITAWFKDGSSKKFIMHRGSGPSSTTLCAQNSKQ